MGMSVYFVYLNLLCMFWVSLRHCPPLCYDMLRLIKIWDKRKFSSLYQQHTPCHTFTAKNECLRKTGIYMYVYVYIYIYIYASYYVYSGLCVHVYVCTYTIYTHSVPYCAYTVCLLYVYILCYVYVYILCCVYSLLCHVYCIL